MIVYSEYRPEARRRSTAAPQPRRPARSAHRSASAPAAPHGTPKLRSDWQSDDLSLPRVCIHCTLNYLFILRLVHLTLPIFCLFDGRATLRGGRCYAGVGNYSCSSVQRSRALITVDLRPTVPPLRAQIWKSLTCAFLRTHRRVSWTQRHFW